MNSINKNLVKRSANKNLVFRRFKFLQPTTYNLQPTRGFTIIEVLLVLGIIVIVSTVAFISLSGRKGTSLLDGTVRQMGSLLREAQSKSVSQVNGTTWGVVFDNTTTSQAFYGMFKGTSYTPTTSVSYYHLPASIYFTTSTIAAGSKINIYFSQVSGAASASATIGVVLQSPSLPSSTISVNSLGAVNF